MTDEEKIAFEKEIREKIIKENRQKKAEWRESHRDNIRASNEKYYQKLRERKILEQASEILARRRNEETMVETFADKLDYQLKEVMDNE